MRNTANNHTKADHEEEEWRSGESTEHMARKRQ